MGNTTHNNPLNTHYSHHVGTVRVTLNLFVNVGKPFLKPLKSCLCPTTDLHIQNTAFHVAFTIYALIKASGKCGIPGRWVNDSKRLVNSPVRAGQDRRILLLFYSLYFQPKLIRLCTGLGLHGSNQIYQQPPSHDVVCMLKMPCEVVM